MQEFRPMTKTFINILFFWISNTILEQNKSIESFEARLSYCEVNIYVEKSPIKII